jgi:hypothetical protein
MEMGSSVRFAGLGQPIGLEISEIMMIGQARGLSAEALAHYLPAADGGMRAGLRKMKGPDGDG